MTIEATNSTPVIVTAIVWSKAMARASQVVSPIPVVSSFATQNISVISGTLLSRVESRAREGVVALGHIAGALLGFRPRPGRSAGPWRTMIAAGEAPTPLRPELGKNQRSSRSRFEHGTVASVALLIVVLSLLVPLRGRHGHPHPVAVVARS